MLIEVQYLIIQANATLSVAQYSDLTLHATRLELDGLVNANVGAAYVYLDVVIQLLTAWCSAGGHVAITCYTCLGNGTVQANGLPAGSIEFAYGAFAR